MFKINDVEIKEKFKERYEKLTDWDEFIDISLQYLRRSIRVNTLKISVSELKKRLEKDWLLTPIPWCSQGFWIEHKGEEKRRDIGNLLEHQLGYIYIQEAVSMIPPLVLDPKPGEKILDIAAAPGSKTTQMAALMKNKGVLVANDYTKLRMKPLTLNLQRCGVSNNVVTLMNGERIKNQEFDKILVDAPCSGTGTIRKSYKTLQIWNPDMVKRLSITQKNLLDNAYRNLRKGGTIVYSTCTLEPHEDEEVIDWFITKHPDMKLQEIKLDIKRGEPILEFQGKKYSEEVKKCLRIWPQDNNTEGFFIAKIKKN